MAFIRLKLQGRGNAAVDDKRMSLAPARVDWTLRTVHIPAAVFVRSEQEKRVPKYN